MMVGLGKRFLVIMAGGFIFAAAAALSGLQADAARCSSSWSKNHYKSYGQIYAEVQARLGPSRILRIQLCGSGAGAYFHVVALSTRGGAQMRHDLKIPAR